MTDAAGEEVVAEATTTTTAEEGGGGKKETAEEETLRGVLESCAGTVPGDAWQAVLAAAAGLRVGADERGAAEAVARAVGAAVRAAEERAAAAVAAVLQQGTLFEQERAELKAAHARALAAAQARTADEQARVKRREGMLHKLNQELGAARTAEQRATEQRAAAEAQRDAAGAEAQRLREASARYVATVSHAVLGQASKFRACADLLHSASSILAFPDDVGGGGDENSGHSEGGAGAAADSSTSAVPAAPASAGASAGAVQDTPEGSATTTPSLSPPPPAQSPVGAAGRLAREERAGARRTSSGITSGRELVRAAVVESEKGLLQLMEEARVLHARAQRAGATLVGLGEQLLAAHDADAAARDATALLRRECFWTLALTIKTSVAQEPARPPPAPPAPEDAKGKKKKKGKGKKGESAAPAEAQAEEAAPVLQLRGLEDLLDAATALGVPVAEWPVWIRANIVDDGTPLPDH